MKILHFVGIALIMTLSLAVYGQNSATGDTTYADTPVDLEESKATGFNDFVETATDTTVVLGVITSHNPVFGNYLKHEILLKVRKQDVFANSRGDVIIEYLYIRPDTSLVKVNPKNVIWERRIQQ